MARRWTANRRPLASHAEKASCFTAARLEFVCSPEKVSSTVLVVCSAVLDGRRLTERWSWRSLAFRADTALSIFLSHIDPLLAALVLPLRGVMFFKSSGVWLRHEAAAAVVSRDWFASWPAGLGTVFPCMSNWSFAASDPFNPQIRESGLL